MFRTFLLTACAALALTAAPAKAAEQHTIAGIAGDHVELEDGTTYSTSGNVSGFNEGDDVTVTDGGVMIDGDEEVDVNQE